MIITLLIIIGLIFILLFYRFRLGFIYKIPVYIIAFNILGGFFDVGSGIGTARNITMLVVTLAVIIEYRSLVFSEFKLLFVFLAYGFVLCFFSSNFLNSIKEYIVVFYTLLMFPAGYYLVTDKEKLNKFTDGIIGMAVIFVLNGIFAKNLGARPDVYGGTGFTMGGIAFTEILQGSIFLIALPSILGSADSKSKKALVLLLGLGIMILLILSLRRTSVIIVLIAFCYYAVKNRNYRWSIVYFLIVAAPVYFLFFSVVNNAVSERLEDRPELVAGGYSITQEYRYLEYGIVYKEVTSNAKMFLVGRDFLNSQGNYNQGRWGTRVLHSDFTLILDGSGFIGLILYLLIIIDLFRRYRNISNRDLPDLSSEKTLLFILIVTFFVVSFQGGISTPGYRTILLLYLGALYGTISNSEINNNDAKQKD
ncbi:MAG: hypothetical protein JXB49_36385 [Bacteroidales bacterium]|nr:hypothetical protein [Bacteroidales bacterium]